MVTITIHWQERKKGDKGYLIIRGMGKPIWEPIGLNLTGNSKADEEIRGSAERIRAKRLIEITERGYELPPTLTDKDFLQYYKKVIDERPEYERRGSVYKHLSQFSKDKRLNFRDINEAFWNNFKKYLVEERKHSQYTIHTILSILKAVLNRAVRDQVIFRNPLQNIREKRPKSTRTYLTLEELRILKETPCGNDEVKKAFFFSCYTGLRVSDVRKLKKGDLVNNYITITMQKTKDDLVIPFDKKALKYLPQLDKLKDTDLLFHLPAKSSVSNIVTAWGKAAKLSKRISFHTSRHVFGTLHLTYGTSIEVLKELMGHKDIRETQIYAKIIDRKKVEAISNLPEI